MNRWCRPKANGLGDERRDAGARQSIARWVVAVGKAGTAGILNQGQTVQVVIGVSVGIGPCAQA